MTTFVQNTIIVTVFLLFRIYTLYCQNLNKRLKTTIRTKIHPHLSYSPCKIEIILWNDIINDSLLVINDQLKSSAYQNSYSSNKIKTMILSLLDLIKPFPPLLSFVKSKLSFEFWFLLLIGPRKLLVSPSRHESRNVERRKRKFRFFPVATGVPLFRHQSDYGFL